MCVCVCGKLEINRRTAEELTHNNLMWKSAKKSNKTHTVAVLAPRPQLHVHSYLQVLIHLCEIVAVLTVQKAECFIVLQYHTTSRREY